ncbi:MAG: RNA polymerase sigma factor [Actinomycetota bacterium]
MARSREQPVPDLDPGDQPGERRFRSLYTDHYRSIQAYAVRRVPSPADVSDVVADVFTIAWRRLGAIPDPPDDRLWLYGVARRVVAGRHRSARRSHQLTQRLAASAATAPPSLTPAASDPAADPVADNPAVARLRAAMSTLRPADREALTLVLWDDLSHADAGQVLGCSANAVAIRVHRAKARLRAALAASPDSYPARRPSAVAQPNRK